MCFLFSGSFHDSFRFFVLFQNTQTFLFCWWIQVSSFHLRFQKTAPSFCSRSGFHVDIWRPIRGAHWHACAFSEWSFLHMLQSVRQWQTRCAFCFLFALLFAFFLFCFILYNHLPNSLDGTASPVWLVAVMDGSRFEYRRDSVRPERSLWAASFSLAVRRSGLSSVINIITKRAFRCAQAKSLLLTYCCRFVFFFFAAVPLTHLYTSLSLFHFRRFKTQLCPRDSRHTHRHAHFPKRIRPRWAA